MAEIAIDSTREGYWVIDKNGRFLDVNTGYCHMIGFSHREILFMRITDLEAYASEQDVEGHLERSVAEGYHRFETCHRHSDGHFVDIEMTVSYLPQLSCFVVFLRDITERKQAEQELILAYATINKINNAFYWLSSEGQVQSVNDFACQSLGYSREELIGLHVWDFDPDFTQEDWISAWAELKENGVNALESRHQRKDGSIFPIETNGDFIVSNGVEQAFIFVQDITNRKKLNDDLRWRTAFFEALVSTSADGILVVDAEGKRILQNQRTNELLKIPKKILENPDDSQQVQFVMNQTADPEKFIDKVRYLYAHSEASSQDEVVLKDGTVLDRYSAPVIDSSGHFYGRIWSFRDITQHKQDEVDIYNLAFYDPLTQLPNRRLLLDRLNQALATSQRNGKQGALLFLDLDHFKILNDTLGHDMGDMLLQQVAARLTASIRQGDTVARLGGDEFVVLLDDLSEQSLEAAAQTQGVAEKILFTLNQPYQFETHTHHSTSSIGATLFRGHEQLAEELLKQADIAMYQSKAEGRNTLRFFNPIMQEAITVRADMENELRKAIVQTQFQLYYQIQVDSNGQALGAEALIRWLHPQRGMILPFNFISLAEDTGLILPIGQWVLDTACAQLKAWQCNPLTQDLMLAVNVSAKQFRQNDFVEQVLATIARHDINPTRLKLELTESMLVDNINDIITKMDALSKIGILFSLDDFGTGYSSLQYLKKLPLKQLKIDQSFVRDIVSDSSDKAIVRTIITVAHSLDINVIAEGVETAEQRQYLLDNGCMYYQGYLFSKPVPIDEFEALLKKG